MLRLTQVKAAVLGLVTFHAGLVAINAGIELIGTLP